CPQGLLRLRSRRDSDRQKGGCCRPAANPVFGDSTSMLLLLTECSRGGDTPLPRMKKNAPVRPPPPRQPEATTIGERCSIRCSLYSSWMPLCCCRSAPHCPP
ncbi:unnamed protein product, partial [Ectocarpus sp. 8 AP-2014]